MNTPICDFVRRYADSHTLRLHMPGHKGIGPLGIEHLDITEISGADSLYEASGIIAESEANASLLFGCPTFYSTEGSSQCIRAMLHLATMGRSRRIAAARNVHKTFLSAAALLDLTVDWLYPDSEGSYLSCNITAEALERYFASCAEIPAAVYVTSPDYLGNMLYLDKLAEVCHRHGALLLVDNAHGAYLKFLPDSSRHPIDLGADLCCDSAHKTLPALTGGAYLHVSPRLGLDPRRVKQALALFGSSSPSWLILQSLDACNPLLEALPARLAEFLPKLDALGAALTAHGYELVGDEPMKLTIAARPFGRTGDALAEKLIAENCFPEFHDPDYLVLMPAPSNAQADLNRLLDALTAIPRREALAEDAPPYHAPEVALSIREAAFAPRQSLPVEACEGRVLATPALSCPPCVPIAVCGERIDAGVIKRLRYYGIKTCDVVRQAPTPSRRVSVAQLRRRVI